MMPLLVVPSTLGHLTFDPHALPEESTLLVVRYSSLVLKC
uniref:Uncharacterized protein n=1 Tax=Picea glauca TaxID=3330 RepID=A0A101M0V2_PICGL|nr:hypothetical protein ABT39_MTgene4193 [Picea glauca]